jgi:hypothetical protein
MDPAFSTRVAELDVQLRQLVKPILVLKYLNWPDAIEDVFLTGWRAKRPELPTVAATMPDWRA